MEPMKWALDLMSEGGGGGSMGKVMATATTQERHPIILISCSTLFLCARLLSSSITPHPDPFCSMTASGPRFCFFVRAVLSQIITPIGLAYVR